MLQRAIPSTNEMIPVIGLGTWKRFDVGLSSEERLPLNGVLTTLSKIKGTLIDSSPMYGRSEEVIGDLTNELNIEDNFFYATKVWASD